MNSKLVLIPGISKDQVQLARTRDINLSALAVLVPLALTPGFRAFALIKIHRFLVKSDLLTSQRIWYDQVAVCDDPGLPDSS